MSQRFLIQLKAILVNIAQFFENIESGATMKEFLEWFPEVEAWQVEAVLKHGAESLKLPA